PPRRPHPRPLSAPPPPAAPQDRTMLTGPADRLRPKTKPMTKTTWRRLGKMSQINSSDRRLDHMVQMMLPGPKFKFRFKHQLRMSAIICSDSSKVLSSMPRKAGPEEND